jgi:hypothetical protein
MKSIFTLLIASLFFQNLANADLQSICVDTVDKEIARLGLMGGVDKAMGGHGVKTETPLDGRALQKIVKDAYELESNLRPLLGGPKCDQSKPGGYYWDEYEKYCEQPFKRALRKTPKEATTEIKTELAKLQQIRSNPVYLFAMSLPTYTSEEYDAVVEIHDTAIHGAKATILMKKGRPIGLVGENSNRKVAIQLDGNCTITRFNEILIHEKKPRVTKDIFSLTGDVCARLPETQKTLLKAGKSLDKVKKVLGTNAERCAFEGGRLFMENCYCLPGSANGFGPIDYFNSSCNKPPKDGRRAIDRLSSRQSTKAENASMALQSIGANYKTIGNEDFGRLYTEMTKSCKLHEGHFYSDDSSYQPQKAEQGQVPAK